MKQTLLPTLDDLGNEQVLVQAWKKTAQHLRAQSWYVDTLELDYQSLRLPSLMGEIEERLQRPELWEAAPLEMVPAPKSQTWQLRGGVWKPSAGQPDQIRPLAHVALADQVVATAMLLCLADRVEQRLGDPLLSIEESPSRRQVLAYGHRLLCDQMEGGLHHRWGSSKLYRLFSQDYQTFLHRPEVVVEQMKAEAGGYEVTLVQSDLSRFYDRVRPALLLEQVGPFAGTEDAGFSALLQRVFCWRWRDEQRAAAYSRGNGMEGGDSVALPQGLVAAGFFANVALHGVEQAIRASLDRPLDAQGRFMLKDACYYVDDLRLVLLTEPGAPETEIEDEVAGWLQGILNENAAGLRVERSKTWATVIGRQERFVVPQARAAKRIQQEVSGGFDMLHGSELIGAIEGFFLTQRRYSAQAGDADASGGLTVGIPDMQDGTAARFAAGRYRRTFRSLRPLLLEEETAHGLSSAREAAFGPPEASGSRLVLSRRQLDERAEIFSAMLIEEWVSRPGHVRLLRVALDLYPDLRRLERVLKLLEAGWRDEGLRGAEREVRLYCLAEVFRAGATETGVVADQECLPAGVDVRAYHERLVREASEVLLGGIASPTAKRRFPWYLLQQAFFYLVTENRVPKQILWSAQPRHREVARYQRFSRFLAGHASASLQERAIYLVLACTAFGHTEMLQEIARGRVSPAFLRRVWQISPETARGLWEAMKADAAAEQRKMAQALGLETAGFVTGAGTGRKGTSLAELVVGEYNPFWQEENLLRLALGLLEYLPGGWPEVLTPWQVECEIVGSSGAIFGRVREGSVGIHRSLPRARDLFTVPAWCAGGEESQRLQLGMILRFALRGSVDFYSNLPERRAQVLKRYHPPVSHWEAQRTSSYQGRNAFGPGWTPISSWVEDLLFDLLRGPGSGAWPGVRSLGEWKDLLQRRIEHLTQLHGPAAHLDFLEQAAPWPYRPAEDWRRPLRIAIVQSMLPGMEDYERHWNDPELLADPVFRRAQRRHLASGMEAVRQMLRLRATHGSLTRCDGRMLDLLVFPELAVHPLDIDAVILPFLRTHRCMALFGQVYHRAGSWPAAPLINSCLWMIPEWSARAGFQILRVEQGKENLARTEVAFSPRPAAFRPAQWIIEYQWSSDRRQRPLRLSASVCFDATDLALAADLKSRSDIYIVCALNRDAGTFDRMSEGLHYPMYQGVMVVNNGEFGGSCFYLPFGDLHHRQVFHLHGQPQAGIAFAEIAPEKLIHRPTPSAGDPVGDWKAPPAGWE